MFTYTQDSHKVSYLMNREDFKGQDKYRYIVPALYILSWVSMILGPLTFPESYSYYCMFIVAYLAMRSLVLCGQNVQLVIHSHKLPKQETKMPESDTLSLRNSPMSIYHSFVIPNYNQPIQLLNESLQVLARHKRAQSTYIVFLAMQAHEKNSQQKALCLTEKFTNQFLHLAYTVHQLRQNQHKGKASNINWCMEKASFTFKKLMIHEENIMVTVLDADSWVPQIYLDQLETHLFEHFQHRHSVIYQPPQIYTRNNTQASLIIRTYDDMYSSMHAASLVSFCGITFSLSNYTLSYTLIKRVGFWDTVQEAIGQDMHMCLKAMFKTNGQVKTVPIFTPFNQLNIHTGNGLIADLKEKFWQVQRHARGVADLGYCLNMLSRNRWTLKTVWMTLSLFETLFLPIVSPWPLFVIFLQFGLEQFQYHLLPVNSNLSQLMFLVTIANTGTFVSNLIYEIFKRRSNTRIYNLANCNMIRVFQCSILSTINLLFMTVPAFVIGGFGNLLTNRQYRVSKKGIQRGLNKDLQEWSDLV